VTDALCRMLERYHPIWVNTHFNHPKELTPEAAEACDRLLRAGIPVGNQSVLLRGINDDPETMRALCEGLVRMRVRPYYCYQAQLLEGTEHFRVPVEHGVEIFRALRGRTSGFAIPTYVLDTPYGKVPLSYPYLRGRDGDYVVVEAWDRRVWRELNPAYLGPTRRTSGPGEIRQSEGPVVASRISTVVEVRLLRVSYEFDSEATGIADGQGPRDVSGRSIRGACPH
jgi:lysine 2,3-aminomutase